jgi:hypothetical protein
VNFFVVLNYNIRRKCAMPYISKNDRKILDHEINILISCIKCLEKKEGAANYTISRILAGSLKPENGWNYSSLADVIKTYECAKIEFYNRMLTPYEHDAIQKNDDIVEYLEK